VEAILRQKIIVDLPEPVVTVEEEGTSFAMALVDL
jgi:hypothetical protein